MSDLVDVAPRAFEGRARAYGIGLLVSGGVLAIWIAATPIVMSALVLTGAWWERAFTVAMLAWCAYGFAASGFVFLRPHSAWRHLAVIAAAAGASIVIVGAVLAAFD